MTKEESLIARLRAMQLRIEELKEQVHIFESCFHEARHIISNARCTVCGEKFSENYYKPDHPENQIGLTKKKNGELVHMCCAYYETDQEKLH